MQFKAEVPNHFVCSFMFSGQCSFPVFYIKREKWNLRRNTFHLIDLQNMVRLIFSIYNPPTSQYYYRSESGFIRPSVCQSTNWCLMCGT